MSSNLQGLLHSWFTDMLRCCDVSTKRNILTMLNDIDVRFVGTTPQLFAISLN